jgi:2-succinyl-5-enolpyruvyl-6-hydroxy-3-cyclohexene-1-carboxylate synthase
MSVNATAAAALMAGLAANGVQHAVVSPGSRSTPLVLAAEGALQTHVVLDERVAGFVALGLAKASARPVVLICTSGSAGAHWLPAVIEAWLSRVPLILLTADRPPELHACGAGQTIDQRRLFGAFVASSRDLPTPSEAVDPRVHAHAGAAAAQTDRPVHLNLPFREPLWTPGETARPVTPPRHIGSASSTVSDRAIRALVDRLSGARRGVIYCGPRTGVQAARIDALSAALGWPAFCEAASGARFGAGAPQTRITAYENLVEQFEAPDCVLQFGQAPHSRRVNGWMGQAPVVLVDPYGDRHDPRQAAEQMVQVEADALIEPLLMALPVRQSPWRRAWISAQTLVDQGLAHATSQGCWEGRLARAIAETGTTALCISSSMPFRDIDAFAPARATERAVFVSRGANGIDGIVSTALGVAQTQPTTALVGDLALLHDAGGLLHAGQQAVNLTLVIADNRGGGIFAKLPIAQHPTAFERYFLTPQAGDIEALSAAAGARYQRLDDPAEWQARIAAAQGQHGVDVLHVPIDRAESVGRRKAALS